MHIVKKYKKTLETRGRVYWFDKSTKIFHKIYKRNHLLDDPKSIQARLSLIVKLSDTMKFIPKTSYLFEKDVLRMDQRQLVKQEDLKEIKSEKRLFLVQEFAQSLDKVYEQNFIHGDINRKNIIYSDDRLYLIDFEPSLLQIKDGVAQWMSTKPYRYYKDIQNNNITVNSDFLGFGCFMMWFLLNNNTPQYFADECSRIISEFKGQSFPFENLIRLFQGQTAPRRMKKI